MKKTIPLSLIVLGILCSTTLAAQISITPARPENVDKQLIPYNGSRATWACKATDSLSTQAIIVSRSAIDAPGDTLYIQSFVKKDGSYAPLWTTREVSATSKTIAFWGNRMAFFDADKDGNMETLFIYSVQDQPKGNDQSIHLVLHFKNECYTIVSAKDPGTKKFTIDTYSPNFESLPESVKLRTLDFWNKLDKL